MKEETNKEVVYNLIQCTCDEMYKSRGMSAPDCAQCNYADDIVELLDKKDQDYQQLKDDRDDLQSRYEKLRESMDRMLDRYFFDDPVSLEYWRAKAGIKTEER